MTLRSSCNMRSAYSRDLGERMRAHPQQQGLERLPGPVDAEVGRRAGGQDAAHRVERLGPGGGAIDELAVGRIACHRGADVFGDEFGGIAVRIEDPIEITDVAGAERAGEHGRITEIAVPSPSRES